MRKKVLIVFTIIIFAGLILTNQYTVTSFHMNVFQYFFGNHQLTQEDRDFLKANGPIVYAADNNSPPLRFLDAETGQYKGIVIDYLRALSIELETEIHFKPMIWEEALSALKRGETDLCDMYPSKARSEIYLFSDPVYYQRGIILVNKADLSIRSASDLKGKKVAVQKGDYVYEFLNNSVSGIQFVFTNDYEENMLLIMDGKVDAVLGDEPVISYFLGYYDIADSFSIVDEPLYELPSVLSLPLNEKKLQMIINKGIYALNQKNIINKIQQKWFGISTPIGNDNQMQKITLIIIVSGLLVTTIVLLVLFWNLELKKAVDAQTMALNASKNNLQTIIDGLNHLIVVVAEDMTVLTANSTFYKLFSIEDHNESVHLDAVIPGITENIKMLLFSKHEACEHMIKGKTYWVTTYAIQYPENVEMSTLLMFEDVTDWKINEARMLQDNKMAAIGQLATGVAHEIRNPLGLIRNYAFLLKRSNQDEAIMNQSLSVIEESVDKASSIIDNLLNFSRLSDDTIREVSLKVLIENLVGLNDKLMNRSKLKCILILADETIFIQEESLKHILMNLMNNAIDAMPNKGQVTIWLKKGERGPIIHVIDKGMGMTQDTKDRLFDPFFTTKKVGEGTGLGLYIVYSELNKMNGKIDVVSKRGIGTTFKIQLKKNSEV